MALQANIPLQGGITHNNGYVRVTNARICRKDNQDNWFLMVDVSVYKDADERAKAAPEIIPCPSIDKFKYATGTRAIYLACELGATEVYIIGHDLYSTDDKVNNIYAGTPQYASKDAPMKRPDKAEKDDLNHWIKQHKNTFDTFKDTKFYKVNPNPIGTSPIDVVIPQWQDCNNLEYITQHELDKTFKL